jgi:phosphoribosyl-ATP pyrophosphohydrolase/phosphoribosyl-AMP cyclohydrolase
MKPNDRSTDRTLRRGEDLDGLTFWENGLLPVVVQCVDTGRVLMVAFANREALEKTLGTRQMHFWSRSRAELWHKGATSGNYQDLISLHADCDGDTLLARVRSRGPACHTGEPTCFGMLEAEPEAVAGVADSARGSGAGEGPGDPHPPAAPEATLPELWNTLTDRARRRPEGSYTVELLENENLRLKKLGEETTELVMALSRNQRKRGAEEAADLVYHILAALLGAGVTFQDLLTELEKRKA